MKKQRSTFEILYFTLSFYIFIFVFFIAKTAFASELFLTTQPQAININDQIKIDLLINSEESVNAIEGKIIFSPDFLSPKEIVDGNSVINFWVEKPNVLNGAIPFSGIIPGGFEGRNGFIFSATFETRKAGIGDILISDARALLNDGNASPASLNISHLKISVNKRPAGTNPVALETDDTEPPETFQPQVAKDKIVFGGKWFLAFAAQDKGSGIARYEVYESRLENIKISEDRWTEAQSPYLLKDQSLKSYVYVKAIDYAGNERTETVPPRYPLLWYEKNLTLVIIALTAILTLILFIVLFKRYGGRKK